MKLYKLTISLNYCENMTFSGETDNIRDVVISRGALIENGFKPLIFKNGKRITITTLMKDYKDSQRRT